MAKRVRAVLTLQLESGKASPAPPVGPALGQHGVSIMDFVKSYNERTAGSAGEITPAQITIYEDRSFTFELRTPPASDPRRETAGAITTAQVREIAEKKMVDLNANDVEAAMKQVAGTARSMGVEVRD